MRRRLLGVFVLAASRFELLDKPAISDVILAVGDGELGTARQRERLSTRPCIGRFSSMLQQLADTSCPVDLSNKGHRQLVPTGTSSMGFSDKV